MAASGPALLGPTAVVIAGIAELRDRRGSAVVAATVDEVGSRQWAPIRHPKASWQCSSRRRRHRNGESEGAKRRRPTARGEGGTATGISTFQTGFLAGSASHTLPNWWIGSKSPRQAAPLCRS
jgi:hypothetical protein